MAPVKCHWLHTPFSAKAHAVAEELQHLKCWGFFTNLYPSHPRLLYFQLVLGWGTKQAPGMKHLSLLIQPWNRATSRVPEEVGGKKNNTGLQGADITAHTSVGA